MLDMMFGFWFLIIIAALLFYWSWGTHAPTRCVQATSTALDILRERYARGEINDEEFQLRKQELLK